MAARSAPAVGLAAACVLVTAVGLATIRYASDSTQRLSYVGAVIGADEAHAGTLSPSATPKPSAPAAKAPAPASRPTTQATASQPAPLPPAPATSLPKYAPINPGASASPTGQSHANRPSPRLEQAQNPPGSQSNLSYAQAVFQAINQARASQHLPPLAWSTKLAASAGEHNAAMAKANTLSHQVGDEPSLGARETAAGLRWSYAAENIGWTTAQDQSGALAIEASMFAETPPSDAHRRNILSTSARAVGVDVLIDGTHGRLWLTEDFANVG
ncbi:MAG: CAP domain-containing protein [Jatrophihabitantaceae bacterium]